MKSLTFLPIFYSFLFCILFNNYAITQTPTCEDFASSSTQQWGLNPTLNHAFLDDFNQHTVWYKFPIVRNRQYFRFKDIDDQGNLPSISYQIYQLELGGACSELELIYSGGLGNIDDEVYAESFEVGNYSGYIKFTSPEDINFKFAVMFGDPENDIENGINVQTYEGTGFENSSTLALPEDPNVGGVVAWYNFTVSSVGAYYINASSPIPGYPATVALHRSDYSIVTPGASDYHTPSPDCLALKYLLDPGSYKIKVKSLLNGPPGFAHLSLHGPPTDTPNDRMVDALSVSPSNVSNLIFTPAVIKRASKSPQITQCTNEFTNTFQFSEDIWYSFTATQSNYYFIIKNIVDHQGDLVNIKMSILNAAGTATVGSSCEQFFPNGSTEAVSLIDGLTIGESYLLRIAGWDNEIVCGDAIDCEFDFCLARPDCITNDDCATATSFTAPQPGQDATLLGSTLCATNSTSGDCNTAPEQDAWWSFTATQTSYDFTLTAFNGVFTNNGGIELEINSDCSGTTLPGSCLDFLLNQTVSVVGLTIGQTYYLRLNGQLTEATFSLLIHAPLLSAEDECSVSSTLSVSSDCDFQHVSTENSSQSPEGICGSGNNDDVWYNFTATSPLIKFSVANILATQGSVSYIYFGIYESCGGAMVACFALTESEEHIVNTLTNGQAYKLQMFTAGTNNKGTFDVCLQSMTPVSNDDCANAIAVSPQLYTTANPVPIAVNTLNASIGVIDCDGNPADDELWYSFTANSTSYLFKQTGFTVTSGIPSGFNDGVLIEFFEACSGVSLGCYFLGENVPKVVVFNSGQAYKYRVWTPGNTYTASFNLLQLQLPNTPTNDYCDAPIPVTVSAFDDPCNTVAGSTFGGTYSNDSDCATNSWDDVYFSFTADYTNVAITIDNVNQLWGQSSGLHLLLFDACLSSYIGVCSYLLEGESLLYGNLTIGQTYYLKVSSHDCVECYTAFDLCIKEGGPPNDVPNFNFEYDLGNATPLPGSTVNASFDAALGLPSCVSPGTPIQDVWYFLNNFEAVNGQATISNATSDIKSAIYKGDINTPANLEIIPSTCGSGSHTISLSGLEFGQHYWLRVWSENGNSGTFDVLYEDITAATAAVAGPSPNACTPTTSVTVNGTNLFTGIPVMLADDPVLIIYPNGNDLGQITVDFYVSSTPRTDGQNIPYLKRNLAITPQFQPTPGNPVLLRFLMTQTEFDDFAVSLADFKVTRVNDQPCASAVSGTGNTLLSQPYSWANGSYLDGYYFDVETDHFSSFYAHSGNIPLIASPLPVELLDFQAKTTGNNETLLTWRTASETNNKGFFIEKSTDGRAFENLGFVAGAGNSLVENRYSFLDEDFRVSAYYRLRQVDFDGSFQYSHIVAIQSGKQGFWIESLYPNPAASLLTLRLFAEKEVEMSINILDVTGRKLGLMQFQSGTGFFDKSLDVRDLTAGVYVLDVQVGGRREFRRFLKK